jgi:hypothetical protein
MAFFKVIPCSIRRSHEWCAPSSQGPCSRSAMCTTAGRARAHAHAQTAAARDRCPPPPARGMTAAPRARPDPAFSAAAGRRCPSFKGPPPAHLPWPSPRKSCPFVHPGEHARRRPLDKFSYSSDMCPRALRGEACPNGNACPFSHNIFEVRVRRGGGACQRAGEEGRGKHSNALRVRARRVLHPRGEAASRPRGVDLLAGPCLDQVLMNQCRSAP